MRLPEEQIQAGGGPRGLHRLAFGHRLPDEVTGRADKAEFSGSYLRRMKDPLSSEAAASALAALGDRIDASLVMSEFDQDVRPGWPSIWDQWWAISAGIVLSDGFTRPRPNSAATIA
jgi:hypothetical protein